MTSIEFLSGVQFDEVQIALTWDLNWANVEWGSITY